MKTSHFFLLSVCLLLGSPSYSETAPRKSFSFGVIAHDRQSETSSLSDDLAASDEDNLAFVVVNGIKMQDEPCSDDFYHDRLKLLDNAKNGLIPSLTADDWTGCLNSRGRPAAMERLNRVRELFFSDQFSLGASRIPVIRQSLAPKFRSYSENTRWIFGNVLFATINLPDNNNNYLPEAGRNSEFEDRLIASEDWLQKTFAFAKRRKLEGIVFFCDANPLAIPSSESLDRMKGKRDGFLEVRKQLTKLSTDFQGRVLIVHRQLPAKVKSHSGISWNRNLGQIGVKAGWIKLNVSDIQPIVSIHADSTPPKDKP